MSKQPSSPALDQFDRDAKQAVVDEKARAAVAAASEYVDSIHRLLDLVEAHKVDFGKHPYLGVMERQLDAISTTIAQIKGEDLKVAFHSLYAPLRARINRMKGQAAS